MVITTSTALHIPKLCSQCMKKQVIQQQHTNTTQTISPFALGCFLWIWRTDQDSSVSMCCHIKRLCQVIRKEQPLLPQKNLHGMTFRSTSPSSREKMLTQAFQKGVDCDLHVVFHHTVYIFSKVTVERPQGKTVSTFLKKELWDSQ